MTTTKVAVTIDAEILAEIDQLVAQHVFPSRSRVVQDALREKLARIRHTRLAEECAKLDPRQEQELAEEGLAEDAATWPEY